MIRINQILKSRPLRIGRLVSLALKHFEKVQLIPRVRILHRAVVNFVLKGRGLMVLRTRQIILVQENEISMKLSDAREAMYLNTGTVSELCRKLSYSGLAIVWIIHTSPELSANYQTWWIVILIGYVIALACDLLQYFVQGLLWGRYNDEKHDEGVGLDEEVDPPKKFNQLAFKFYYVKFSLVIITTLLLLVALSVSIFADNSAN